MNRRQLVPSALFLWLLTGGAAQALAQNLIMNSAETINVDNFKISAFPTVLLGEGDADNEWGLFSRFGYGFTPSFDVEGKVAFFSGLKLFGADAELWLLKHHPDVSIAFGVHRSVRDAAPDSTAFEGTLLASGHVGSNLEVYGGLNLGFESLDDSDENFTRTYIVPGIEYRLSEQLDLLAEFGIGLNDDSPNYLSFGLALYFR